MFMDPSSSSISSLSSSPPFPSNLLLSFLYLLDDSVKETKPTQVAGEDSGLRIGEGRVDSPRAAMVDENNGPIDVGNNGSHNNEGNDLTDAGV